MPAVATRGCWIRVLPAAGREGTRIASLTQAGAEPSSGRSERQPLPLRNSGFSVDIPGEGERGAPCEHPW